MVSKIFAPHELKTIEVDTEKKIFRVNGQDFGEGCTGFSISCCGYLDFDIRMEVDTTVRFVTIRNGELVSDVERPNKAPWFSDRPERTNNGK